MEKKRNVHKTCLCCLIFFSILTQTVYAYTPHQPHNQVLEAKENMDYIEVGVILDMRSFVGKTIYTCINMAILDFYSANSAYKTRIVLRPRDSEGNPLLALSAANDLVEKNKVAAIISPQTNAEAKFLAVFSKTFEVPIFSLAFSPSAFTQYPLFVQIGQDDSTQFKTIASLVQSFKWRNVIFIYEDADFGRDILPYMVESFLQKDIKVVHTSAISPLSDQILEELLKLMKMQTTVFVVHMSPLLASNFFLHARRVGLVGKEYVWILTDKTMDVLHTTNSELVEALQGVIGLRTYIPPSKELQNLTLRWRKEQRIKTKEMSVFGILAYDAIWTLAKAIERTGGSKTGKTLVGVVSKIRFQGLSGEYGLVNGRLIGRPTKIVNVIGKYERRLGFWTIRSGIRKSIALLSSSSSSISNDDDVLEAIIWPGGSTTNPRGWSMRCSKKLRVGFTNSSFKEFIQMERNNITNDTVVTGFCVDVFRAAIDGLTYQIDYELIPVFLDANGNQVEATYNDYVYGVYLENYDALIGDITITANRSQYVDFTLPFTDMGVGTVVKRVDQNDMWIFLRPLDMNLWLTSLALFIFTGFIVWVIEHPSNSEFQGSPSEQIGAVFWFTFSTLFFAHREKLTNNLSKFLVVVWLFAVLILTSSYTATLTSLLTVQQIRLTTTKNDFIGYHGNSNFHGFMVNNLNFEDERLRPYSSAGQYAEALSRGSKNGGVSAIMDEIPYLKSFLARYPNDYAVLSSQSITNGFGFAFRKGSPLASDISGEIAKLREEGELMRMEDKWFKSDSSFMKQDTVSKPKTLDFYSFRGLFLITGLSSTLALFIFFIYMLYQYLWPILNFQRLCFIIVEGSKHCSHMGQKICT